MWSRKRGEREATAGRNGKQRTWSRNRGQRNQLLARRLGPHRASSVWKSLGRFLRRGGGEEAISSEPGTGDRGDQERPKSSPRTPKIVPRSPKVDPTGFKSNPTCSKNGPTAAREPSRSCRELQGPSFGTLKKPQRAPKSHLRHQDLKTNKQ